MYAWGCTSYCWGSLLPQFGLHLIWGNLKQQLLRLWVKDTWSFHFVLAHFPSPSSKLEQRFRSSVVFSSFFCLNIVLLLSTNIIIGRECIPFTFLHTFVRVIFVKTWSVGSVDDTQLLIWFFHLLLLISGKAKLASKIAIMMVLRAWLLLLIVLAS